MTQEPYNEDGELMELLIDAIINAETVYLSGPTKRELYILDGVRIRYVDGKLAIGGQIASSNFIHGENFTIQLWSHDRCFDFAGLAVDIIEEKEGIFFNAVSVPGMSKMLFSDFEGQIMKEITLTI